jgi:hypothetical protein
MRVWSQRLFAARADGRPSTLLDEAARRTYFMCTHIRPSVISAIAVAGSADDVADPTAALGALSEVLVKYFEPLQRTFVHYAASEPGEASTMGAADPTAQPHPGVRCDALRPVACGKWTSSSAAVALHFATDFDEFHKALSESGLFAKPTGGPVLITAAEADPPSALAGAAA